MRPGKPGTRFLEELPDGQQGQDGGTDLRQDVGLSGVSHVRSQGLGFRV